MFTHKNMPFIRVKVGVENGGDGYVAANEIGIT
jgi:NAD(P)H-hydrate repair Nnr-like enzyme with NAD(P)H-hydrate epimerase domain